MVSLQFKKSKPDLETNKRESLEGATRFWDFFSGEKKSQQNGGDLGTGPQNWYQKIGKIAKHKYRKIHGEWNFYRRVILC